jgi:eukaryotic-like serine/threonine-protein kinase
VAAPVTVAPAVPAAPVMPQVKPAARPAEATASTTPEVKVLPSGTVRLAISPWGRVFVGRRAMGVAPPLTQITLPQGRHVITIRNDDAPPYTQTVNVRAGQSVSISHSF